MSPVRQCVEARNLGPVLAAFDLRDGYAEERAGGQLPAPVRRARIQLRGTRDPGAPDGWRSARGRLLLVPTPGGRLAFFGGLETAHGQRRLTHGQHRLRVEADGFGLVETTLDLDQGPLEQRLVLPPGPAYADLDPPGTPRLLQGVLGQEAGLTAEDREANARLLQDLLREDDEPRWPAVPVRGSLRLRGDLDPTDLLVRSAAPPIAEAPVAADGQWLLPALVPPGGTSLALEVHRRTTTGRERLLDLGELPVAPDRPTRRPGPSLAGRLVAPGGAPLPGLTVQALDLAGDRSDPAGRWTLLLPEDAPPGQLRLRVLDRDGRLLHERRHPMPQRGSTAEPPSLLIEIDPQGA